TGPGRSSSAVELLVTAPERSQPKFGPAESDPASRPGRLAASANRGGAHPDDGPPRSHRIRGLPLPDTGTHSPPRLSSNQITGTYGCINACSFGPTRKKGGLLCLCAPAPVDRPEILLAGAKNRRSRHGR